MTARMKTPEDNARIANIAFDRVAGDCMDEVMTAVERMKKPFADLGEFDQTKVIEDIEGAVQSAIRGACMTIAAGTPDHMAGTVKQVQLKGREDATATVTLWLKDNEALISAAELSGGPCVVVGCSEEQWMVGLTDYRDEVEPDQGGIEFEVDDVVPAPPGSQMYNVYNNLGLRLGTLVMQGKYKDGDIVTQKAGKKEFAFSVAVDVDDDGTPITTQLVYGDKPEDLSALPFFTAGDVAA